MADPNFLEKPAAGGRYDPEAVDATGTTLGDVLTSVSDGSGGKRAGWVTPSGGSSYTDEQARDAVGAALVDSATIDFTVNDGADTITAAVVAGSIGPTELASTAVTPGSYGDATHVSQVTLDADGRATAAANVAITFPDTDPGVSTGTPGNWSHAFVTEAGGRFVLGAHDTGSEPLDTGMRRTVLGTGTYIRGQATVKTAGYAAAYLDCRVSLDNGLTWETDLLGIRVPLNTVGHAVGVAVLVDPAFEGEVLLDAVVVAGNGTTVPEILNFVIESTSV